MQDIDGVFHQAALTVVQDSFKMPEEYHNVNVKGTDGDNPYVEELEITTEHAPFRHRPKTVEVGGQKKTQKNQTSFIHDHFEK